VLKLCGVKTASFKMKIACIGWGSLIWRPEGLPIHNKWFEDGPILPIEFTRHSSDDRITLIIDEQAKPVRTLWSLMTCTNIDDAVEALKQREGVKKLAAIHFVTADTENAIGAKSEILNWIKRLNLDAAIWTGLAYSDKTNKLRPTLEYVIDHLRNLQPNKRKHAEEYIRRAPKQIDTDYRRQIEFTLGWTHRD
jgi:hypothetical protein